MNSVRDHAADVAVSASDAVVADRRLALVDALLKQKDKKPTASASSLVLGVAQQVPQIDQQIYGSSCYRYASNLIV